VLREWTVLSSVCSQCTKEWGWLKENPMTRVKHSKEPEARTRRLLPGEFEQLMIATQYDIEIPPEFKKRATGIGVMFISVANHKVSYFYQALHLLIQ